MEYAESTTDSSPFPFIGRRQELSELERALDNLKAGDGGVFVIEGEPGIGKSRLVSEFATRARRRDAKVLWAMCDCGAESAPPLWPWIQIAHQQSRDGDPIESGANAIANGLRPSDAVPMLANAAVEVDGAPAMRLAHLSRAAVRMLTEAARAKPLVLIFDDAERTDEFSLELLAAVAAQLRETLVIVSCYAAALRQSSAHRKALSSVFDRARWIQLRRFEGDDLMRLVEARARFSPEPGALGSIKRMSGGNPGFVELVVDSELMGVSNDPFKGARLMPMARIAVERHLRPFSDEVRSVLRVAATIGHEFELRVLDQVCAESQGQAADIVEEMEAAGVIRPVGSHPGLYTFAHALVREALREETPRRESVRLHKQIALALLNAHTFEKEYLGDIATHLFHGAVDESGDPKPTRYCERAAEYAEKIRDFAGAARFYRMALVTLDPGVNGASSRRCDLLLALGRVESRGGDDSAGSSSLAAAAELAELNRDPVRFARAALASAGGVWHLALGGRDAPHVNSLLEKSLRMLGDSTAPEAAMVSARLAAELYSRREAPERQRALSEQAGAVARGARDTAALLSVLHQRHLSLLSEPSRGCERLRNAEEMLAAASTLGGDEQWCLAFALRQTELLRDGDLMRADVGAAALSNAARTIGTAVYAEALAAWTATRAFIEGRFEKALTGAWRFLESAEKRFPEAVALFLPGAVTMLREKGRLGEIERLAARCADAYPWLVVSRAALAQIRFELGEVEEARAMLRAQLAQGFTDLADNASLPTYAAALVDLSADLGEHSHADELYEVLLPYELYNIVLGPFAFAGPAARYLGILATMRGKLADAEKHFVWARRLGSRTAARPWVAYTEIDYAGMLLDRDGAGDREMASRLVDSALGIAQALKMSQLATRAGALGDRLRSQSPKVIHCVSADASRKIVEAPELTMSSPTPESGIASARAQLPAPSAPLEETDGQNEQSSCACDNVFKREGDYWTIVFANKVTRLRHAKGLSMIAWLLRHPHREFLAWTLDRIASGCDIASEQAGSPAQFARELPSHAETSDSGPLLDAQTRTDYARRVKELQEDLAEAKSFNDIGRVSAIEEEIGFITSELCRGLGLGGRARKWPSETERARVNVTNAVRTVVAKIRRDNPALARYLSNTVKTGRFCTFDPDPSFLAEWTA